MKHSKQISILGCGWLGFPLAEQLLKDGYSLRGSVRKESDLEKINNSGIEGFLLELGSKNITGDIVPFLDSTEILIISIPPGLRKNPTDSFVEKIKVLLPFLEKAAIKKVLFISSTSVYANDNSIVTEKIPARPETKSGKQLLKVERLLCENPKFQTSILRFGGLIGSDRHPIYFLAGRENLKNPKASVNLIHRDDCIEIIRQIIRQNKWGETFNAVAPFHPTKEVYYTDKAHRNKLPAPTFDHTQSSRGKTIDSEKIKSVLLGPDYVFKSI